MIGYEDVLSPAEQLLWSAYYALEPYTGELRYLAHIEAILLKAKQPSLPSECRLDVPLEDQDIDKQKENVKSILTALAEEQLGMSIEEYIKAHKNG